MAEPEDEKSQLETKLFVSDSSKYGDAYIEHLLEQYKTYIQSIENISDRRQKSNEFFVGLNTGLVTLLGFLASETFFDNTGIVVSVSALAGITFCYLWYRMVRSYQGLNSGKFEVVHTIEKRLPLALYDTEWEALGRGEDHKKYWPFTHIEKIVPWIFVAIYSVIILAKIPWNSVVGWLCNLI